MRESRQNHTAPSIRDNIKLMVCCHYNGAQDKLVCVLEVGVKRKEERKTMTTQPLPLRMCTELG